MNADRNGGTSGMSTCFCGMHSRAAQNSFTCLTFFRFTLKVRVEHWLTLDVLGVVE